MATFEVSVPTQAPGATQAYTGLRTANNASSRIAEVLEIRLTNRGTTASEVALIVLTSSTGTPGGNGGVASLNPDIPNSATDVTVDTGAYGVQPTLPGTPVYNRRDNINGVVGNGIVWTWAENAPLIVPKNSLLLLVAPTGGSGGALNAYFKFRN